MESDICNCQTKGQQCLTVFDSVWMFYVTVLFADTDMVQYDFITVMSLLRPYQHTPCLYVPLLTNTYRSLPICTPPHQDVPYHSIPNQAPVPYE
jgi:hypothetical protein